MRDEVNKIMTTMMKLALHLSLLTLAAQDAAAFGPSSLSGTDEVSSRNVFMKNVSAGILSLATVPQVAHGAAIEQADGKILRSNKCAYGEGAGCDDLAGDNEFIKELQRKSAERKEAAQKEYLSAYQMKNYPDFFASLNPPKYMVKKSDGTFDLYDDAELAELKKAGRIKLEKPTAMGGKVADVTQKPILVLVDK